MQFVVGIDTGGTFTDVTTVDEQGNMAIAKSATTRDYVDGIISALGLAARDRKVSLDELFKNTNKFVYGTTMATNWIIQRNSDGRVGLITTKGFADTLYIRRTIRVDQYDCQEPFPTPFVRRIHTREVTERVDWAGNVLVPLNVDEVRRVIRELTNEKKLVHDRIEAIAVCLFHSYANSIHERRIAELIHEDFPEIFVSLSVDIAPEIREYERVSTTVFNACVGKPCISHFKTLEKTMEDKGLQAPILVMHSMGGTAGVAEASFRPVTMLYSGPAAGVVAANYMGSLLNLPNIVSVDMGGTSLDVGIIQDGKIMTKTLGEVASYPIMGRRTEIHTIGAGGGSTAWVDKEGILKVGPNSAGADPGPACYDKGGVEPTVTDADVVLGYIDPANFLGGTIKLNLDKAYQSIKRVADRIGMDVPQAASGIIQIVQQNMINAMRVLTVERGIDTRDFVLMAFGGAGPTHSAAMFKELGTQKLVVPNNASVFSSFGALAANLKHSYSATHRRLIDELDLGRASKLFKDLEEKAKRTLKSEGMKGERIRIGLSVDMSYVGQLHELNVPISSTTVTPEVVEEAKESFAFQYEALYGLRESLPVQVVTFRVEGIGEVPQPVLKKYQPEQKDPSLALKGYRDVYFESRESFVSTSVYDGSKIRSGNEMEGPAIVEYINTTLVIRPDQYAFWDEWLNAIIA